MDEFDKWMDLITDMRRVHHEESERLLEKIAHLERESANWKEAHEGQQRNTLAFASELERLANISAELLDWHEQELPKISGHLATMQVRNPTSFEVDWKPCGDIEKKLKDMLDELE